MFVFQDKKVTRITLVYQVDVCVDGCVLMCVDVCVLMCVCKECVRKRTKGKGHGLCVCVFMSV